VLHLFAVKKYNLFLIKNIVKQEGRQELR